MPERFVQVLEQFGRNQQVARGEAAATLQMVCIPRMWRATLTSDRASAKTRAAALEDRPGTIPGRGRGVGGIALEKSKFAPARTQNRRW
jgi:hypothetical protein